MDASAAAAAAAPLIGALGGAFMTWPATIERSGELGLHGWDFYMIGRGGVLGDVPADVVRAAFVFFPARTIDRFWVHARAVMSAERGVQEYVAMLHRWGRERLTPAAGLERIDTLTARLVEATDVAGLALYAGWRALPLPDDLPARVAQRLMVLREHRGGVHGVSVLASGLPPLHAILAGTGGEGNARFFGWKPPYPDVSEAHAAREQAEALTARLATPPYETLSEPERHELVTLLGAAHAEAFA